MKYDLEVVIPVSSKYAYRIEDLKRYGIFNVKDKSVLLTLILSGEKMDGLLEGWENGIDARVVHYDKSDYVANTYRNFLEKVPESRWIMKADDDSCTDIDGMVKNLDQFYDSDEKFYLATSIVKMCELGMHGQEGTHRELYLELVGGFFSLMSHEIECSVVSSQGLNHILSNKKARNFLERRIELAGGGTDIALAFAASLSKLHPVNLFFSSHLPLIQNFSSFGGFLNHIHMVSRTPEGDNFHEWERCGRFQYDTLCKSINGSRTEMEKVVMGNKFVMETERELRLYEFKKNLTARIKFDDKNYIWSEHEGRICLSCERSEIQWAFDMDEKGNLLGKDEEGRELVLRPLNF